MLQQRSRINYSRQLILRPMRPRSTNCSSNLNANVSNERSIWHTRQLRHLVLKLLHFNFTKFRKVTHNSSEGSNSSSVFIDVGKLQAARDVDSAVSRIHRSSLTRPLQNSKDRELFAIRGTRSRFTWRDCASPLWQIGSRGTREPTPRRIYWHESDY